MQISRNRLMLCSLLLVCLLAPELLFASGTGDRSAPARVYDVRWYNMSAAPLVPAEKDPVTQAIERRFSVKLTLLGGTYASKGYYQLYDDIETNKKLDPTDAKRKILPDVYPWAVNMGEGAAVPDLYVPLPYDEIRTWMPRTWTNIQVVAKKQGMDPAGVWAPFERDGVPYAIPQPNPGWMFPAGVMWRADVLERLGQGVPATIEDWEAVFRAYRQAFPMRIPWTNVWGTVPFAALFDATGVAIGGYVERDGRVQPALIQPEMRMALLTLRRWYENQYVALAGYGSVYSGPDTNKLFIAGQNIVTADAKPDDGSWICQPPFVVGSIPDLTSRRVPGATFVMAPRPVFSGVKRAVSAGRALPFGGLGFGFNATLASQPEKLHRLMGMVDSLANDDRMYLTAMYGIEGAQWEWERTGDGRYPRKLAPSPAANTGTYWIYPYSPHDAQYSLMPRVLDSITRYLGSPTSLYGTGEAEGGNPFTIPYADAGPRATADKARFQKLSNQILGRFYDYVFFSMVINNAGIGVFDEFVKWYRENGGDELEQIVTRWAGK